MCKLPRFIEEKERLVGLFPFWVDMAVPMFMLISGYVSAVSFQRNRICTLGDAYGLPFLYRKMLRYTVPFAVVYIIELVIAAVSRSPYGIGEAVRLFLVGGNGPGSYYYPIMMQFILLFPLIYFSIRRNPKRGLLCWLILNLFYEVLQRAYGMNEETYRLLLFRYVFLIAAGCFICFYEGDIKKSWLVLSFFIGVIYILLVGYSDYQPKIIIYWTGTSFVAAFYIIPVFYLLINKLSSKGCRLLEQFGKASFDIFLTQMVYYCGGSSLAGKFLPRPLHLLANLVICLSVGLLFYAVESRLTNCILVKTEPFIQKLDRKLEQW